MGGVFNTHYLSLSVRWRMSLRHVYCVPASSARTTPSSEIARLASQVSEEFSIPFETRRISGQKDLKKLRDALTLISVRESLRIAQTVRNKRLYPHLLICDPEIPIAFFPQIRKVKDQKIEIRIEDYLKSLLGGSLKSLIPIPPLEERVPRREEVDEKLLKEAYLARSNLLRKTHREWIQANAEWPE